MKKRVLSTFLIICLVVTMLVPSGIGAQESYAAGTFTVRDSMPKLTDPNAEFYYSDLNRFWKAGRLAPDFKYYDKIMDDGKTGGYIWGNCTWWVYGRASEVAGQPITPELRGNAGTWYDVNKKGKFYPYGQTPKVGAIVVYSTHVAFVEKIVNGQIYVSESGWQTKSYGPKTTDDFYFNYGIPWRNKEKPKGYIYVTEKASVDAEIKPANYSIEISYKDLNMRSGPGTGYGKMGYAPVGTHKITAVTADGLWGQLETNGYWVCLEYTQKVVVKSSNNNLSALAVTGYKISPAFNATTTSYSVSVPYSASSIVITAKKADSKAAVNGTGTKKPKVGANTYTIKVTAEDGKAKTYTIKVTRAAAKQVKVTYSDLNMRTGPATSYKSKGKIKPGVYTIVSEKNGWGKVQETGYWICLKYTTKYTASSSASANKTTASTSSNKTTASSAYKVKIKCTDLNMRTGPGTSYKSKGKIKPGTYTIAKTSNGWGKLSNNGYWISLKYTTKVK